MIDSIDIKLPHITSQTTSGKIAEMQSYLYQLAEQLNWAINSIGATETKAEEKQSSYEYNFARCKNTKIRGSLFTLASKMTSEFAPIEITSTTTDIPGEAFRNAVGYIHKSSGGTIIVWLVSPSTYQIAMAGCLYGTWSNWKFITPQ